MSLPHFLRRFLLPILIPVSLTSLIYIYLYPIFHGDACAFPLPTYSSSSSSSSLQNGTPSTSPFLDTLLEHIRPSSSRHSNKDTTKAPFRLLILADPQLEGDTSLPSDADSLLSKISEYYTDIASDGNLDYGNYRNYFRLIYKRLSRFVGKDIPKAFKAGRKRLDLLGNDYYLGHIYRTLRWWVRGTHTVVLGDLVGSQWIGDEEFEERGRRFWGRAFKGGRKVEVDDEAGEEVLGEDEAWGERVINVAGNHDVGYAGDISREGMERFERVFGKGNWDVRFRYPVVVEEKESTNSPTLHMVVLNNLILDTPALDQSIQDETYGFINDLISNRLSSVDDEPDTDSFTLLLTHIPLHKREGICTDAPYFGYHEDNDDNHKEGEEEPRYKAGGLREQNHLSEYTSQKAILEGLFGMSGKEGAVRGGRGRNGLILTGHDHTGCDVLHFVNQDGSSEGDDNSEDEDSSNQEKSWAWDAKRYNPSSSPEESSPPNPSIREVTLRSMMGEYDGNAGFLSVWFDPDPDPSVRGWKYEISTCMFGVQHIWWAGHVVGIVTGLLFLLWVGLEVWEVIGGRGRKERERVKEGQ